MTRARGVYCRERLGRTRGRPVGAYCQERPAKSPRGLVWTSMRVLTRFTTADLETTTSVSAYVVSGYVRELRVTGYLRLQRAFRPGVLGSRHVYVLVRDSDPKHPIVRDAGTVWDPNLKTLFAPVAEDAH